MMTTEVEHPIIPCDMGHDMQLCTICMVIQVSHELQSAWSYKSALLASGSHTCACKPLDQKMVIGNVFKAVVKPTAHRNESDVDDDDDDQRFLFNANHDVDDYSSICYDALH